MFLGFSADFLFLVEFLVVFGKIRKRVLKSKLHRLFHKILVIEFRLNTKGFKIK